jgi:hypothetical protein
MKLRALIGITLSSLALCSAANASLVISESSTTAQKPIVTPSVSAISQGILGRSQAATPTAIVQPAPEPESWTLAAVAIGAMALVLRRKSRK